MKDEILKEMMKICEEECLWYWKGACSCPKCNCMIEWLNSFPPEEVSSE